MNAYFAKLVVQSAVSGVVIGLLVTQLFAATSGQYIHQFLHWWI